MTRSFVMRRLLSVLVVVALALLAGRADAASAPPIFRILLTDGTDIVSYGEYARVGDDVVFSVAAGGSAEYPRLQLVTLPAANIDWTRTERFSESVRAAHYAATRGDEDFAQLSNEVARVLNDIALSSDRTRALALAQRAHDVLAQWPKDHYHYRESDVREILTIIDNAIANLRGEPPGRFDLSLVASGAELIRELPPAPPSPRTELTQLLRVADMTTRAADRTAVLQSALSVLEETKSAYTSAEVSALRETIKDRIEHENDMDRRYSRMSQRLSSEASRAAADARTSDVERVLAKITREDRKLGAARPETVQALRATVEAELENARRLRLLRDQWLVRQSAYNAYERRVGRQIAVLVKVQPMLDAIRRLDGPAPDRVLSLKNRLAGGADRLQRLEVPPEMKSAHDLLVGAWRFAENAASGRFEAITTGNVTTAWMASSAAAGSMMLLSRAQNDIRSVLEIPRIK
jgi:hypothetical protein